MILSSTTNQNKNVNFAARDFDLNRAKKMLQNVSKNQ